MSDDNDNRTFNYSSEEVQKMFKNSSNTNSYDQTPTIRPLLETDKFPETILESYYDL